MIASLAILPLTLALAGGGHMPPVPPDLERAEQGPVQVVLDNVPGCYGSVSFDHRLHVEMTTMTEGCAVCHHDVRHGGEVQPCRACHEPGSAAVTNDRPGLKGAYHRQCLGCHRDWAHENACGLCHLDAAGVHASPTRVLELLASLGPTKEARDTYVYETAHEPMPTVTFHHTDHAEVFGLGCVDCHSGSSCADCHGSGSARPVVSREDTCLRCHERDRCITCHGLAPKPRFSHSTCAGWRLRSGHAELACDACHGARQMPTRPESSACAACHGAETGGVFDHAAMTGVVLYGDHALFGCVECHAAGSTERATCTACHADQPVRGFRSVGELGGIVHQVPAH